MERVFINGQDAKNLRDRLNNPDPNVMQKRDQYLRDIKANVQVKKDQEGNVIISRKKIS